MKIIALQAENIKKLIAVEIKPDGNLVQITGKNGQGKTSVLDSIWWALSGLANIQGNPIRQGQNKAKIRLDLGEVIVTRTFKKTEEGNTLSYLAVENAEGTAIRQPQTMLDRLIGELSFDPLAFSRMTKREQFEQLKRFVPNVDFEAIEKAHQEDYDKRTNVNRQAHEAKVLADAIFVSLEAGAKAVDEAAIVDEIEAAGHHNTHIESQKSGIESVKQDIKNKEAQHLRIADQIKQLEREQVKLDEEIDALKKRLASTPAIPAPIDVTPIKARLAEARKTNEKFRQLDKKKEYLSTVEQYNAESDEITARMKTRTDAKQAAIAAAKLPVPGLGFGDGEILLNGVPFNQASDAEQLQVSISMAMALNPKLRVIRVRDGSLLDEDSLKLLEQMAILNDFQCWVERVGTSEKAGFILEDGHLKQAEVVNV